MRRLLADFFERQVDKFSGRRSDEQRNEEVAAEWRRLSAVAVAMLNRGTDVILEPQLEEDLRHLLSDGPAEAAELTGKPIVSNWRRQALLWLSQLEPEDSRALWQALRVEWDLTADPTRLLVRLEDGSDADKQVVRRILGAMNLHADVYARALYEFVHGSDADRRAVLRRLRHLRTGDLPFRRARQ